MNSPPNKRMHRTRRDRQIFEQSPSSPALDCGLNGGAPVMRKPLGRCRA
jgi:hypothetical protein